MPEAKLELKPCPFCGGDGFIQGDDGHYCAGCLKCDCALGERYDPDGIPEHKYGTAFDAIDAWNLRSRTPLETELIEALDSIQRRFAQADKGTLHVRDGVAWAMASDARAVLDKARR